MKKGIHYIILLLGGLVYLTINYGCTCDPVDPFEVWTVSPEDGAIINDPEVTLYWRYSPSGSHSIVHNIYTGTSYDDMTNVVSYEDNDTSHIWASLEPSTTYFWAIESFHSEGVEPYGFAYSDTVSFTTADVFTEMKQAHSPYPDSGATLVDSILAMYWSSDIPDGEDYIFDVYLGTPTDPPLVEVGLTDTIRSLDTLAGGTTYYWKVVSYNESDTVDGNLWCFTTVSHTGIEIFTLLEVDARQTPSGYHVEEHLRARFDTAFAIAPIHPLQADSVFCEGVRCDWSASGQSYSYIEFSMPFIENGQPVDFTVYSSDEVASLDASIVFPACTLGITSPESFESVSIDGFEVLWDGSECGGTVWLTLTLDGDSTGVFKEISNDGIDSLTAIDLQPLGGQGGTYNLIIFKWVQESINAPGYMPQSIIRARAINVMEQISIF